MKEGGQKKKGGGGFGQPPPHEWLMAFGPLKYASLDHLHLKTAICHIIRQLLYFDGYLLATSHLEIRDCRRKTRKIDLYIVMPTLC